MLLIDSSVLHFPASTRPNIYLGRSLPLDERARERGANLIPCLSRPSLPSCRRPQDGEGKWPWPLSLHMPPTDHITYFLMSLKEGQSLKKVVFLRKGEEVEGEGRREYEFSIDADLANQWGSGTPKSISPSCANMELVSSLSSPSCLVLPPPFRLHR